MDHVDAPDTDRQPDPLVRVVVWIVVAAAGALLAIHELWLIGVPLGAVGAAGFVRALVDLAEDADWDEDSWMASGWPSPDPDTRERPDRDL